MKKWMAAAAACLAVLVLCTACRQSGKSESREGSFTGTVLKLEDGTALVGLTEDAGLGADVEQVLISTGALESIEVKPGDRVTVIYTGEVLAGDAAGQEPAQVVAVSWSLA